MKTFYLKEYSVPIPYHKGSVVIRRGKTVEFQLERVYSSDTKDSRVKRKVIGKVDPADEGMMFPNETYFMLFPENSVPAEIRENYLYECRRKREIEELMKCPGRLAKSVAKGLELMKKEGIRLEEGDEKLLRENRRYALAKSVFDQLYGSMMDLAEKRPNEVADKYKVKMINEVLTEIRKELSEEHLAEYLAVIPEPEGEEGEEEGLTYSDVFMAMQWYKILQRGW